MRSQFESIVPEDSQPHLLSRFTKSNGVNAQQADVASIALKVFDLDSDTPNTATVTRALTVASVVFDTLQTSLWTRDSTGYNFKAQLASTDLPDGARRYLVEVVATLAAGGTVTVGLWSLKTRSMFSS